MNKYAPARRRWRTGLLVAVLAALSLGAHETDTRVIRGSVMAEATTADVARCAYLSAGPASQGAVGWVLRLRSREDDGYYRFRLSSISPGQRGPLAITFYRSLGSCETLGEPLAYGRDAGDGSSSAVEGWVPSGARWAVIGRWSPEVSLYYTGMPEKISPGVGVATSFRLSIWDGAPWVSRG